MIRLGTVKASTVRDLSRTAGTVTSASATSVPSNRRPVTSLFMADLLRRVPIHLQVDCLSVSSYHGTKSTGRVNFRQTQIAETRGRHVLILDDILDSGVTLHAIREYLAAESGALSLKICVLLRKKIDRPRPVDADYVGFDIPNEFVVGYGLDYNQRYRNLPLIGVLTDEAIQRHRLPSTAEV